MRAAGIPLDQAPLTAVGSLFFDPKTKRMHPGKLHSRVHGGYPVRGEGDNADSAAPSYITRG